LRQIEDQMKFSIDKQERYTLIKPEEENLNSSVAPKLKSEFVILANEGIKNLILDLSSVAYVDSSGLSAILTARRLWTNLGTFIVTGIEHDAVKRLVEISKVDSVLTILPTVSESVDYIFMEELQRDMQGEPEAGGEE
jgi:anti-sigma B factor antagonist